MADSNFWDDVEFVFAALNRGATFGPHTFTYSNLPGSATITKVEIDFRDDKDGESFLRLSSSGTSPAITITNGVTITIAKTVLDFPANYYYCDIKLYLSSGVIDIFGKGVQQIKGVGTHG